MLQTFVASTLVMGVLVSLPVDYSSKRPLHRARLP